MPKISRKPNPAHAPEPIANKELGKVISRMVTKGRAKREWQVQTAKAQFSEVFRRARTEGPQHISRAGKEGVVMISDEQYNRLFAKSRQPRSIVEFFRQSPLVGVDLDMERDKDTGRDVDL